MTSFSTSPTPNPNSVKITTDEGPFIDGGLLAFNSAAEADEHPLGRSFFGIDGIENVLIMPSFVTVTKTPDAYWEEVMPAVESILQDHLRSSGS